MDDRFQSQHHATSRAINLRVHARHDRKRGNRGNRGCTPEGAVPS